MSEVRSARLAVLIDADNVSSRYAEGLFEEIAKIGEASVRRIYGDFSGTRLKSWSDILPRHAIIPHHNVANTPGKNATDIAMVIDAMDLLHSGRFDGFCLVSSDSDFTRLAARIREQGIDVYGFGRKTTPVSFRQACLRFIYTENLQSEELASDSTSIPANNQTPAPAPASAPAPGSKSEQPPSDSSPKSESKQPPSTAVSILERAISLLDDEEGWVALSSVGSQLGKLAPDFDPRTYGHAKLSDLVKKTGAFDVELPKGKGMRIRPKKVSNKKSTPKK